MNTRIRTAMGQAMASLVSADVARATAAIQRALAGAPGLDAQPPRRLGDVLRALQADKARLRATPRPAARQPEPDASGGRFRDESFAGAGGSVSYKLYVPEVHPGRGLALVVMLHGCTQDPDDFARGTKMNALADEFGLIVAYPQQPRSANAQGCWNWFDTRHQRRGAGEPAVLAGLAAMLVARHGIDRERVFVAGLSAGGAMAEVLLSTYPDVFRAAGIHSGLPHGAARDVASAFAAMKGKAKIGSGMSAAGGRRIVFHGSADMTVHPSNGETVFRRSLSRGSFPRESSPQELATDAVINGKRVTRTVLGAATGPAVAEHWLIHGGGHAWSGGNSDGSHADATGPDASREMIRFFLAG